MNPGSELGISISLPCFVRTWVAKLPRFGWGFSSSKSEFFSSVRRKVYELKVVNPADNRQGFADSRFTVPALEFPSLLSLRLHSNRWVEMIAGGVARTAFGLRMLVVGVRVNVNHGDHRRSRGGLFCCLRLLLGATLFEIRTKWVKHGIVANLGSLVTTPFTTNNNTSALTTPLNNMSPRYLQ